jgi:hypothetical protein
MGKDPTQRAAKLAEIGRLERERAGLVVDS